MSSTVELTRTARRTAPRQKGAFSKRNWIVRLLGDERGAELAEICVAGVCVCAVAGVCFKVFENEIPGIAKNVMAKLNQAVTEGEMPANKAIVPASPAAGAAAASR